MMAKLGSVMMMMVILLAEVSAQCDHGEVRLVNGGAPNEGRVEVCGCSWGTVCDDFWSNDEAKVVCRQLGYRSAGAQAFSKAHFGQGLPWQAIALDNVVCNGLESTLLQCRHDGLFRHNCLHNEDAGARCSEREEGLLSTQVNILNAHTVFITWRLQNSTLDWPSLYLVECFSPGHRVEMSVNNSLSVQLMGLIPSTTYNCCVSAVYESYVLTPNGACVEAKLVQPGESNGSNSIIGGVLGFIIVILLILLAISGAALVYVLRPKLFKRIIPKDHRPVGTNSTDIPVRGNISYATTPSRSTISSPQGGIRAVNASAGQNETDAAAADYSRIGPSYEIIDSRRQQPAVNVVAMTGRGRVSARLSERYEFSEPHPIATVSAAGGDGGGGGQGGAGMDYQVPLESGEHDEEYSRLQH